MKMEYFDERQLWMRGHAFKHMVFVIFGILLFDLCYNMITGVRLFGDMSNFVWMTLSVTITSIEMMEKGIYSNVSPKHNSAVIILLICGGLGALRYIATLILDPRAFFIGYEINETYGMLFINVCFLCIACCYCIWARKKKG